MRGPRWGRPFRQAGEEAWPCQQEGVHPLRGTRCPLAEARGGAAPRAFGPSRPLRRRRPVPPLDLSAQPAKAASLGSRSPFMTTGP